MRLIGLVLQNKKGENVVIATAPSLQTRTCVLYANFIYEHILDTYRKSKSIQGRDLKSNALSLFNLIFVVSLASIKTFFCTSLQLHRTLVLPLMLSKKSLSSSEAMLECFREAADLLV